MPQIGYSLRRTLRWGDRVRGGFAAADGTFHVAVPLRAPRSAAVLLPPARSPPATGQSRPRPARWPAVPAPARFTDPVQQPIPASVYCGRSRNSPGRRSSNSPGPGRVVSLAAARVPGGDDTPGSFVGPVAWPVHDYLVAGVDDPVEEGFGDDGVGEQGVPVGGCPVGCEDQGFPGALGDQLVAMPKSA